MKAHPELIPVYECVMRLCQFMAMHPEAVEKYSKLYGSEMVAELQAISDDIRNENINPAAMLETLERLTDRLMLLAAPNKKLN